MYVQDKYEYHCISQKQIKNREERSAEFPGECKSKNNCPLVRRSRILFLLHVRESGRPWEVVIIRYEPSRGEWIVPVMKNNRDYRWERERERTRDWNRYKLRGNGKRRRRKRCGVQVQVRRRRCNGRKGKSPQRRCRHPSGSRPILLRLSRNSPDSHHGIPSPRIGARNAKWLTIKAERRWREKEGNSDVDVYLCGASLLLAIICIKRTDTEGGLEWHARKFNCRTMFSLRREICNARFTRHFSKIKSHHVRHIVRASSDKSNSIKIIHKKRKSFSSF